MKYETFLQASYEEDAPLNIDGYVLDEKLSNLYGKVYVNDESKKGCPLIQGDWYGKFRHGLDKQLSFSSIRPRV